MSEILLVTAVGLGALSIISILFVAILSLRALRKGAELEAEMKAASFAFRFHLQPHHPTSTIDELPPATQAERR